MTTDPRYFQHGLAPLRLIERGSVVDGRAMGYDLGAVIIALYFPIDELLTQVIGPALILSDRR